MEKGSGRAGHKGLIPEYAKMVKLCGQDLLVAGEFAVLDKEGKA